MEMKIKFGMVKNISGSTPRLRLVCREYYRAPAPSLINIMKIMCAVSAFTEIKND